MRLIFFSVCVLLLPTLSAPFQTNAQQPRKGTAPKAQGAGSTVRFDSGHSALGIPLDIDNNIIRMDVSVNHSKPLKFIFDTGASSSVISSQRAAELGLKSEGEAHGNATGGRIKGSYTQGVSLRVRGAEVSNQLIASIPINTPPGFDFDGVMGQNFIEQFVVEIDYENKIMNLHDPRTYTYSGKGEVIPLLLEVGKTPLVNTKLIVEGRAPVEAKLEVDTGADGTFVINSPLVKRQKLAEAILKTGQSKNNGAGGEQTLLVGRVKAVQLGRFVFDNPPVALSQDTEGSGASNENDGVIGGEIFRRFKVILDYFRKRMMLEPNKSFHEPYNVELDEASTSSDQELSLSDLLKLPGRVLAKGSNLTPTGKLRLMTYRIEEVALPHPLEVEIRGKKERVTHAFRVTITGGPFPVRALPPVIWIEDVAVGYGVENEELSEITAVTFDSSLFRDDASLYLSYGDRENKADRAELPEKLKISSGKGERQ
jgi:hypothetical protein